VPPRPAAPHELDAVVSLIAWQQADASRQITYLGTTPAGIRAELDGLEPAWGQTARVLDGAGGGAHGIVGAVVVEWDSELGRAWIVGPWVDGDGDAWQLAASDLLDAALAQLPDEIAQHELSGDVANTRLGALAEARGWVPTEANHALVADAGTVAGWDPAPAGEDGDGGALRSPGSGDVAGIAALHDVEFPATYADAAQLVAGHASGDRVVLVAPGEAAVGEVAGYAAGRVQDDGEGFIDFVAVAPAARGTGVGRRLVQALTRQLLDRSSTGRVCLTVQDHRAPARALYEQLGFRPDGTFLAYRDWTA
jgi:ribosomal protein S18 acetylase RimI-like enzyme